jgi:DNA-binding transcriptional LysR family regulator
MLKGCHGRQYVVDDCEGLTKGLAIATKVAANSSLTNFAATHLLTRIAEQDRESALLTEALAVATVQADGGAALRVRSFLDNAPTVSMLDPVSEWVDHDVWAFGGPEGRRFTLEHRPRLACRSVPALLEAVRAGTGVSLLSEQVCARDFQGGKLVRLLPDWHTAEGTIYLLFTTARGLPPPVGC